MQRLKKLKSLVICIVILNISCNSSKSQNDIAIISEIYKSFPKFITAFPKENATSNNTKGIYHRYAINRNYFAEDVQSDIQGDFFKYKSKKLNDKVSLKQSDLELIKKLKKTTQKGSIDQTKIEKFIGDKLVFVNKRTIERKDKKKYDVNRILTFSKPVYNSDNSKAALYVINYGERLDSSLSVYILHKENQKWIIKYRKPILIS